MKKILLIEDRLKRQRDLLGKLNIDLEEFSEILDNQIIDGDNNLLEDIKNDKFDFTEYSVIIAHESIFADNHNTAMSKIKKYCKIEQKPLVLFSGNNSNSYNNEDCEELGLISTDLYSKNLVLFLEEFRKNDINILILSYGKRWKLNIVLNVLEKVSLFIDTNTDEDIDYDEFKNFTKSDLLSNLKLNFYEMETEDDEVSRDEIVKFREDIITHIKEMADE